MYDVSLLEVVKLLSPKIKDVNDSAAQVYQQMRHFAYISKIIGQQLWQVLCMSFR